MTITRLVSILFCFHAGSSRIVLNFWHSSDHEPNVHVLAHAPRGARTPRGMNAKNRTRRLESVDSDQKRLKEALL